MSQVLEVGGDYRVFCLLVFTPGHKKTADTGISYNLGASRPA
jgi:hypothetical protein